MVKRSILAGVFLVLALFVVAPVHAAVPSDALMPAATRGFASIPDIARLADQWKQSQYGQLMRDESMQPFVQDMKGQLERKLTDAHQKLGIEFKDLKGIAAGEVGFGLIEQEKTRAAIALTVDIAGREEQVKNFLAKVDQDLTGRRAKRSAANSAGVALTLYDIPPQGKNDIARQAVFFQHQDMLVATDSRVVAEEMIARFGNQPGDRLADVAAYRQIFSRVASEAKDLEPEFRWFADPFAYARAMRTLIPEDPARKRTKDYLATFQAQGFDAIQGTGGYVNLGVSGSFELLHRTYVYAPGVDGPEKYKLAMRMLKLPNVEGLTPQAWVPRKLASYRTFNLDIQNAFEHFGTLFDALAGYENAFSDVIEGLEKDPYGPQVKVRNEFIQHLGSRVTMITDYDMPITTKSERFIVVVNIKDEQAVSAAIEKFMKADPNAHRLEFEGKTVWEILPPTDDVPEIDIQLEPLTPAEETGEAHNTAISTSAVCVSDGQLFMASHLDFLQGILAKKAPGETLAQAGDFLQVDAALNKLIPGELAARCFVRTDESYRPTYELLRQGKMPESETLLGRVLNRLLTTPEDEEEGVLRRQKIDGRKLPNFEMVRRYFSPMGTAVRSTDNGWLVVGATLTKQQPQARAGANPTQEQSTVR